MHWLCDNHPILRVGSPIISIFLAAESNGGEGVRTTFSRGENALEFAVTDNIIHQELELVFCPLEST